MSYPSFKATHGRAPIAGQDYDPDKGLCQDEHEFLTGTGRYSDDAITEYRGITLGTRLREIATGKTGCIESFEKMPDGMIVNCTEEGTDSWGAYLHNCEFA